MYNYVCNLYKYLKLYIQNLHLIMYIKIYKRTNFIIIKLNIKIINIYIYNILIIIYIIIILEREREKFFILYILLMQHNHLLFGDVAAFRN